MFGISESLITGTFGTMIGTSVESISGFFLVVSSLVLELLGCVADELLECSIGMISPARGGVVIEELLGGTVGDE